MNWKDRRIHAINRITQKYNNGSQYVEEYGNILKSAAKNKKEYRKEREGRWILTSGRG